MRLISLVILLELAAPAEARMPRTPRPLTWGPLTWSLSVEDARKVLDKAKMAPRYGETHAYFEHPPGEPVTHTVEPEIYFVPRKGWTGEAHFAWTKDVTDYRIDRITLTATALTTGALKDERAALIKLYGKPTKTTDQQLVWIQDGSTLTAWWNDTEIVVSLFLDRAAPLPL